MNGRGSGKRELFKRGKTPTTHLLPISRLVATFDAIPRN